MNIKIKRGVGIPTTNQLENYELGWSTTNKQLYINDTDTITPIGGSNVGISLNGKEVSKNGDFQIYTVTDVLNNTGKFFKLKSNIVNGEDPFEYFTPDNVATQNSTNLIFSGAVWNGLDSKVSKVTGFNLVSDEEIQKLKSIPTNVEENKIDEIRLNNVNVPITNKIAVLDNLEISTNKVIRFDNPTDVQYPSAKLVNDSLAKKLDKKVGTNSMDITSTGIDLISQTGSNYTRIRFENNRVYLINEGEGTPNYNEGTRLLNQNEILGLLADNRGKIVTSIDEDGNPIPFPTLADLQNGPYYIEGQLVTRGELSNGDYATVSVDSTQSDLPASYIFDGNDWVLNQVFYKNTLVADNITLETYGNNNLNIRVKSGGISSTQLAASAVTTDKIANGNVTFSKIYNNPVSYSNTLLYYTNQSGNITPTVKEIKGNLPDSVVMIPYTADVGKILESTANGPIWVNKPTIPSITINGSVNNNPVLYAPTIAGTIGQMLISTAGTPAWTNTIDGGTW